jgi:hypothetical protein
MNPAALQTAIFDRLVNWPSLSTLLADRLDPTGATTGQPAVYDHVPQQVDSDSDYPIVVIGEDTANDFSTDDCLGSEATVTIHIWSRERGRQEAKQVEEAVYDALHRHSLSISGRHVVDSMWEYADTTLDPDGLTRHGVMRFRIMHEKT